MWLVRLNLVIMIILRHRKSKLMSFFSPLFLIAPISFLNQKTIKIFLNNQEKIKIMALATLKENIYRFYIKYGLIYKENVFALIAVIVLHLAVLPKKCLDFLTFKAKPERFMFQTYSGITEVKI